MASKQVLVKMANVKEAFIVSYDNQVIGINVAEYPNTMFEATYNYKIREKPNEDVLIRTERSKEEMEFVLEVLKGETILYQYRQGDLECIELVKEFYPEYEPEYGYDFMEDDEEDDLEEYCEEEIPKKKGPNYQRPMTEEEEEEIENYLDQQDRAYDRALFDELY
jgi:hypothetical protein